jgi:hypothetical protein
MRQLSLAASLSAYLDDLEYTEAALHAEPETAELAAPFHEAIAQWPDIFQRQRGAWRAIIRADAVAAVRDGQLDQTTRRFGGGVLMEAGQDRKSTFFRRFFPMAPSEFIRQGLRTQCERTRDVILPELEKLDASSPLRTFAKPLGDGVKAALAALTARSKAKGEAAIAAADVEEWKEGINQLRRSTYAELMKRAADQKYPREWPEMFFRSASQQAGEEEADEPGTAPA